MMTLDQMKLAVYQKIPAEVKKQRDWFFSELKWEDVGLQICNEAERLLHNKRTEYHALLMTMCGGLSNAIDATYEQRLEALCRVWFPERF